MYMLSVGLYERGFFMPDILKSRTQDVVEKLTPVIVMICPEAVHDLESYAYGEALQSKIVQEGEPITKSEGRVN